jgi:hypothetical protein
MTEDIEATPRIIEHILLKKQLFIPALNNSFFFHFSGRCLHVSRGGEYKSLIIAAPPSPRAAVTARQ